MTIIFKCSAKHFNEIENSGLMDFMLIMIIQVTNSSLFTSLFPQDMIQDIYIYLYLTLEYNAQINRSSMKCGH